MLEGKNVPPSTGGDVREELLDAIAARDSARFKAVATRIGQRKISSDSDWCQDDYLIFLLLLGNELFGRPLTSLPSVLDARAANANPLPRKINEVFAALYRQEFELSGDLSFLKIPFLRLVGKLRLGAAEAVKALHAMSVPELLSQLSPFLRLLTERAHDLILSERQPLLAETGAQLIEAFEMHARNLSLRQWAAVFAALPGRLIWTLAGLIVAAGLVPVLFGIGKGLLDNNKPTEVRVRPTHIAVAAVRDPRELPREALLIAQAMQAESSAAGERSLLITVETEPLGKATPAFVVEASHPQRPIANAFAFAHNTAAASNAFFIIPVQRDAGRFRAVLPEQAMGYKLSFVLQFAAAENENAVAIGQRVVLRALQ